MSLPPGTPLAPTTAVVTLLRKIPQVLSHSDDIWEVLFARPNGPHYEDSALWFLRSRETWCKKFVARAALNELSCEQQAAFLNAVDDLTPPKFSTDTKESTRFFQHVDALRLSVTSV